MMITGKPSRRLILPRGERLVTGVLLVVSVSLILALSSHSSVEAQSRTFTVLYSFTGAGDGCSPGSVVLDEKGNLYGGTWVGGSFLWGALFRLDTTNKLTVLHNFTGGDGLFASATLIRDAAGTIYGVTSEGGVPEGATFGRYGDGAVFKLDAVGKFSVLHGFKGGTDSGAPNGPLLRDDEGNLLGTAYGDDQPNYQGVVFKIDANGKKTVLHRFTGGSDGGSPFGNLIVDAAGNFYGTTTGGGAFGYVTVFKMDKSGKETVLHSFGMPGTPDGYAPYSGLVRDDNGNLYGTTVSGGNRSCTIGLVGCGIVFKLDTAGKETVLYSFTGSPDGANPIAGLVRDAAGNLYGTTAYGGIAGGGDFCCGTIFKLDTSGKETVLYTFSGGSDGANPNGLILDASGALYGTTLKGGKSYTGRRAKPSIGCGVIFKLIP